MSIIVTGVVKNGLVVPQAPLPEGARVEIRLNEPVAAIPAAGKEELTAHGKPVPATRLTLGQMRRLPREQRQAILAAAAEVAEHDYCTDKELTCFEAFGEDELDDDESDYR